MTRKRALRWQLYDQAIALGLKRRSGGYKVQFLRDFLKEIEDLPPDPLDTLLDPFISLGEFISIVDLLEQEEDKRTLIEARSGLRDLGAAKNRIKIVKDTVRRLDRVDVGSGKIKKKSRGSKTWQARKASFKKKHNMSQDDWREYKRNKLNAQRSSF